MHQSRNLFATIKQQQPKLFRRSLYFSLAANLLDGCSLMILLPLLQFTTLGAHHRHHFHSIHLNFIAVSLIFLFLLSFSSVIRYTSAMYNTRLNIQFANGFRSELFSHITNAKWSFLKSLKTGYLNNMLTMAIQNMSFSCSQLLLLISNVIFSIVYLALSCYYNFYLTLLSVFIGGCLFALLHFWDKVFVQQGQAQYHSFTELTQKINEFISSLKITKLYQQQHHQQKIVADLSEQFNAPQLSYTGMNSLNQAAYLIGGGACFIVIFYFAVFVVKVPLTTLIVMLFIFSRLIARLNSIHSQYRSILKLLPVYNDIQTFIQRCQQHRTVTAEHQTAFKPFSHAIKLSHLGYQYADSEQATLLNFSMTIPFGQITALTGPSGSGKSTTLDLICGLLSPQSGTISIDDHILNDNNIAAWQQQIGYVPQEAVFFHDTIRANLFCENKQLSTADLIQALHLAQAWQFVGNLPNTLDTIIGPNGIRLSGGERQRLALARALLQQPRLLILDEATNALDHENEMAFFQAIQTLTPSITILISTHQPHLCAMADHQVQLTSLSPLTNRIIQTAGCHVSSRESLAQ